MDQRTRARANGRRAAAPLLLALLAAPAAGAADVVTIMAIQGSGERSPLVDTLVTTEGIVTLCTRARHRCWIQDPDGDGDPATSDGLALELAADRRPRLRPGDHIRVRGRVRERRFGAALSHTSLDPVHGLEVLARDRPLPPPRPLPPLPATSIPQAIALWEPLEGMRVRVGEGPVVGPTSRYAEFVMITRGAAASASGFDAASGYLSPRPLPDGEVDYNPERILVGAATRKAPVHLRVGDRVREVVGVVDYSYGNYKIQPARLRVARAPAPEPPKAALDHARLGLASFNLENLFDEHDDPAVEDTVLSADALARKLDKLAAAVTDALGLPAIVAVQEVEHTDVLQRLAAHINAGADTAYRATSFDSSDPRGIEVGVLWDAHRVALIDAAPLPAARGGREPLKAVFRVGGHTLTLVVVHFKSKGGDEPLFGANQPPRRPTEIRRRAQARALRAQVTRILEDDPRVWLAVAGDLNDLPFPEPGEGDRHPLAILTAGQALDDVLAGAPAAQRATYIYQGNAQALDYILVSPALGERLAGARSVAINARFPAALAADRGTWLRSSDHDPLVAEFQVAGP